MRSVLSILYYGPFTPLAQKDRHCSEPEQRKICMFYYMGKSIFYFWLCAYKTVKSLFISRIIINKDLAVFYKRRTIIFENETNRGHLFRRTRTLHCEAATKEKKKKDWRAIVTIFFLLSKLYVILIGDRKLFNCNEINE